MIEKHIVLEDIDPVVLYGAGNTYLQIIKALYPKLRIVARDNVIRVLGDEELMARYSVGMDKYSQQTLDSEELLKKLDSALQEAIGSEEYERAESIKKRIDEIKKGKNSENRYDE